MLQTFHEKTLVFALSLCFLVRLSDKDDSIIILRHFPMGLLLYITQLTTQRLRPAPLSKNLLLCFALLWLTRPSFVVLRVWSICICVSNKSQDTDF